MNALLGLSSADPLRALAELEKRGELFRGCLGGNACGDLMARLSSIDPARTSKLIPFDGSAQAATQAVALSWSRKDPAAAARWIAARAPQSWEGKEAVRAWMRGAQSSGQPLGPIIDSLPPGSFRSALRAAVVAAEAGRNPEASLTELVALPKGFERQMALSALAQAAAVKGDWAMVMKVGAELRWGARSPSGPFHLNVRVGDGGVGSTVSTISSGPEDTSDLGDAFANALRHQLAAGVDPAEVWTALKAGGPRPLIGVDQVLKAWLARDPTTAAEAALEGIGGKTLAKAWSEHDPAAARQFWEELPGDSPQKENFLKGLAESEAGRDPAAALRWIETLPEAGRDQARLAVVSTWARRQPIEAAQAVLAQPDSFRDAWFIPDLISDVSRQDPAVAAPLFSLLSEDASATAHAYQYFTRAYAARDARAASEWIATMPAGASKDQAISGLVYHLSDRDPDYAAAFAWAGEITVESTRERLAGTVFRQWFSRDVSAAKAALEASSLAPAQKKRLFAAP